MLPVLFVVEGDRGIEETAGKIIDLHRQTEVRVYLLSVRTRLPGYVSQFIGKSAIDDFHRDAGMAALAPAARLLEAAGVPHWKHVEVGNKTGEILRFAAERHCRRIFVAKTAGGILADLFAESTAHQVRTLLEKAGARSIQCEEY